MTKHVRICRSNRRQAHVRTGLPCTVLIGDCREKIRELADNSLDSIVCDPPYELNFMGKAWDRSGIAFDVEFWKEAFRVLKPGGFLLSFSGSRTYHRMTVAIEDAGFLIRDQIQWVYGQGMPKTRNIGKDIDKKLGAKRNVIGKRKQPGYARLAGEHVVQNVYTTEYDELSKEAITAEAKKWNGYGTGLKPSHEPICVAQKPLAEDTFAANVLVWGVGALNIDGCRIALKGEANPSIARYKGSPPTGNNGWEHRGNRGVNFDEDSAALGRFPANLIHDGSEEVLTHFPFSRTGKGTRKARKSNKVYSGDFGGNADPTDLNPNGGDSGSAARFFYCAKASTEEKRGSKHPTIKPLRLMRYLVRLVTPPGGTTLDPFAGSGTTGEAALREGFNVILFEMDPNCLPDIQKRLDAVEADRRGGRA